MTGDRAHVWGTGYVCPPDAGPAWRQAVVAHSVIVDLPGGSFRVLGLDDLIQAKAAMDRPRDRLALTQLRAIREARSRRSGPD